MFKFVEEPTYTWPVEVYTPDGGEWRRGEFLATFRLPPVSRIEDLLDDGDAGELVKTHLVGWSGIGNAAGDADLPFTEENRDRIFERPDTRRAIIAAFMTSYGRKSDTVGNFMAPPSIGSAAPELTDEAASPTI